MTIKTTTTVMMLSLLACPALANDFFFKPYVGADYQYSRPDYYDEGVNVFDNSLHGGNVHAGARVHKYLGFEVGYMRTEEGKKTNVLGTGLDTKARFSGFTFDALGYLPVIDKVDLIGLVGVSRLKGEAEISGGLSVKDSEWETKARGGIGAQYSFAPNWNVRALGIYQDADFSETVNHMLIGTVGVNYSF